MARFVRELEENSILYRDEDILEGQQIRIYTVCYTTMCMTMQVGRM